VLSILYLASKFYPSFWTRQPGVSHVVVLGWMIVGLIGYFGMLRLTERMQIPLRAEIARWILLGLAALCLLNGMTRTSLHGGGDARWYATLLADMVAQTRAGVFPVWIGQSEFQYNGAIYTLRVAPAFFYIGATVDALTLHSLGVYALQNLMLVLLGLAASFTAYFTLAALMPGRRTLALGLALLFLTCPGVLGIVYNTDLYMSWTSLPLVPLILYAGVRSFRDGGKASSMLLLGTSLGICWWAHSPIAVWMTFISLVLQVVRTMVRAPAKEGWVAIGLCLAAFATVSAYPIGSVLLYPADPIAGGMSIKPDTTPSMIVDQVKRAFPADLLPVSENGGQLSDFQLGYALWALLLAGIFWVRLVRWDARILIAFACLLVLLVAIPIPHLDSYLWNVVPTVVRRITCEWVMNRLYLILAGAIVFSIALAADQLTSLGRGRLMFWMIALGCVWSSTEAWKFLAASPQTPRDDVLRSENVMLTQYAYFGFAVVPDYFTDGVDDPNLENRLLRDPAGGVLSSNLADAAKATSDPAADNRSQMTDANGELPISFRLDYGKRYLADFEFVNSDFVGVLQIFSPTSIREYALPSSGGPASFGIGGLHSHFLPLWTSNEAGEDISVRFVPAASRERNYGLFARVSVNEYDPSRLPVHISSWIPYRADVRSPQRAWLETPRMFQAGYVARVDGRAAKVEKSRQGLVSIEVPSGSSEVEVDYRPPPGLVFLFWSSLTAFALAIGKLFWALCQNKGKWGVGLSTP
jgi:hypothetical protein